MNREYYARDKPWSAFQGLTLERNTDGVSKQIIL